MISICGYILIIRRIICDLFASDKSSSNKLAYDTMFQIGICHLKAISYQKLDCAHILCIHYQNQKRSVPSRNPALKVSPDSPSIVTSVIMRGEVSP